MKQEITFKGWLANFFTGIWQAICWVGRAFNPKNKTPFWRVVWSIIAGCVLILTGLLVYSWFFYHSRDMERYGESHRISYLYEYFQPYGEMGYIRNIRTKEKTVTDIEWIARCEEDDSLFVFARNGKRGYINRDNGEVAIPEKFQKAWNFSSGVAAVVENDSLYFIDGRGNMAHNRKFLHRRTVYSPMYHGDYCMVAGDNGKLGLIDREGNWAIAPKYDKIIPQPRNFWVVKEEDGLYYVYDDKARQFLSSGYEKIEVIEDVGVVVTMPSHLMEVYGFDGTKSDNLYLCEIEKIYYDKDEWDEDGTRLVGAATLMRYRMNDGYEGLCKPNGDLVTEPIYWEVHPVTKDTYLCKFKDSDIAVLINSNGEIIRRTEF